MKNIKVNELVAFLKSDPSILLIDVRSPQEYSSGHVEGFKNIPLDEVMAEPNAIPKDAPVVVMCHSGTRSLIASRTIELSGHNNVYNLVGGYMAF